MTKEERIEYMKAWRIANPEKAKEKDRRWREANSEKAKESTKAWRIANPEKAKEKNKRWAEANSEKVKENNKRWRASNPDKLKEGNKKQILKISDCYIARMLKMPVSELRKHPDLIKLKRIEVLNIRAAENEL